MHNYKELIVWQKSMQLAINVYKMLNLLPSYDKYILSSQLIRCANSIPSNIAEGAGKNSNKDFSRFLSISEGSSFELETQLILIKETKPEIKVNIELLLKELIIIQKMIYRLRTKINSCDSRYQIPDTRY